MIWFWVALASLALGLGWAAHKRDGTLAVGLIVATGLWAFGAYSSDQGLESARDERYNLRSDLGQANEKLDGVIAQNQQLEMQLDTAKTELENALVEQLRLTVFPGESGAAAITAMLLAKEFGGLEHPVRLTGIPPVAKVVEFGSGEFLVILESGPGFVLTNESLEEEVRQQLGVPEFQELVEEAAEAYGQGADPFTTYIEIANRSEVVPAIEPFVFDAVLIPKLALVRVDTTLRCSCGANRFQPHAECGGTIQPGDSEFFRLEFGTSLVDLLPQLLGGQRLIVEVSEAPEMVEEYGYDSATHTAWSVFLGFQGEMVWEPGENLTIEFARFHAFDLTEGFATGTDQFMSLSFSSSRRQVAEPLSGEPGSPEGPIDWSLCATE